MVDPLVADLLDRVARLERDHHYHESNEQRTVVLGRLAQMERTLAGLRTGDIHEHRWQYAKTMTSDPDSDFGRMMWSWKCVDEDCPSGEGTSSSNSPAFVPDHFPVELR